MIKFLALLCLLSIGEFVHCGLPPEVFNLLPPAAHRSSEIEVIKAPLVAHYSTRSEPQLIYKEVHHHAPAIISEPIYAAPGQFAISDTYAAPPTNTITDYNAHAYPESKPVVIAAPEPVYSEKIIYKENHVVVPEPIQVTKYIQPQTIVKHHFEPQVHVQPVHQEIHHELPAYAYATNYPHQIVQQHVAVQQPVIQQHVVQQPIIQQHVVQQPVYQQQIAYDTTHHAPPAQVQYVEQHPVAYETGHQVVQQVQQPVAYETGHQLVQQVQQQVAYAPNYHTNYVSPAGVSYVSAAPAHGEVQYATAPHEIQQHSPQFLSLKKKK